MRYAFVCVAASLRVPLHKRSDNAFPHAAASRCKVFATVEGINFQFLELPALDQSRKGFGDETHKNALEQLLVAVVDEDNPQRNITVVTDASEERTTEKVKVVVKKSVV